MKLVIEKDGKTREFELKKGITTIGREPGCDIPLPFSGVSRRHCRIVFDGKEVVIRDLGSRNGIYVNLAKVDEATLSDGDIINLGKLKITFLSSGVTASTEEEWFDAASTVSDEEKLASLDEIQQEDEGNKTPVDANFVPQKYGEQPALIARGDRWFLADRATGREIEIAPVGRDHAEPLHYGEIINVKGWSSRMKVLAVAACVIVIAVVVAAVFVGGPEKPAGPAFSFAKYQKMCDEAVVSMRAGKLAEARQVLEKAYNTYPARNAAKMLLDVVDVEETSGDYFNRYNWNDAEAFYESLTHEPSATTKQKSFARERLTWIFSEYENEGVVVEAMDLVGKGELESAYKKFNELTANSIYRNQFADQIAKLKVDVRDSFIKQADQATAKREWKEAISNYEKSLEYFDNPDEIVLARIRDAKENERVGKIVEDAEFLLAENQPEAATEKLQEAPAGSIYQDKIARLLRRIELKVVQEQVFALYDAGKGEEALKILKTLGPEGARVKQRIESVLDNFNTANEAYSKRDFDMAIQGWNMVKQLEPADSNYYRRLAVQHLERLEDAAPKVADEYVGMANQKMRERDYMAAWENVQKALDMEPENKSAAVAIERLKQFARQVYRDARNNEQSNPKEARLLYEQVTRMVPDDYIYYGQALKRLGAYDEEKREFVKE